MTVNVRLVVWNEPTDWNCWVRGHAGGDPADRQVCGGMMDRAQVTVTGMMRSSTRFLYGICYSIVLVRAPCLRHERDQESDFEPKHNFGLMALVYAVSLP